MRRFRITLLAASALLLSCRASTSEEGGEGASAGFAGSRVDVTGSLSGQTGSQSQMQGWVVALVERDSGIARVSEADGSGNLKFLKTSLSATHTAVLLSPDYLVQSVLVLPSTISQTVRQYFQMTKNVLPRFVQKGSTITFQSTDSISIQEQTAADVNSDGIPDGVSGFALDEGPLGLGLADTDKDGLENGSDPDIDGDGVINAFDSDDDGDGVLDVVDTDANGNGVADSLESSSDQNYKAGLTYLAVQNIVTSSSTSLKFIAKVRDGVVAKSVKIRGATSFTTDAVATAADGSQTSWDLSLADDGKNDDGAEGDLLYVRKVTLANGVSTRTNQAIFFQVVVSEGGDEFTAEYPYVFPSLAATVPTTSYDAASRTVTLAGNPFGANLQDFVWTVSVKNSAGIKLFESNLVPGSTRTLALPSNILVAGQSYTYQATAQLFEKIQGYPAMLVQSDASTISN